MRRIQYPASADHERRFRLTFKLRDHLKDDPEWQMAFEHAAKYKLYPDELSAIGCAIERKPYYEPDSVDRPETNQSGPVPLL